MRGVDVSFSVVSKSWCERRRAEGYRVFVQCLWPGGYANKLPNAESNLRAAREAGLICAGYINTNPWFPAAVSIAEAKKNAGTEWASLGVVFNDVEIAGVSEQQIKDHCLIVATEGKKTAIYSAKWFWDSIGNPKWPWLKAFDIWVADYDNDPSFATATLFGPWALADVIGKQYTNTTLLDGVNVDLNEFANEFFEEDDMLDENDPIVKKLLKVHDALFDESPGPFWNRAGKMTRVNKLDLIYAVLTDDADPAVADVPRFAFWEAMIKQGAQPGAAADAKVIADELAERLKG